MPRPSDRPLSSRERKCVEVLVAFHQEFGLFHTITSEALTALSGEPFAGSLATLVQFGDAVRERNKDGISYRLSEQGWAKFAGVPFIPEQAA